MGDSEQQRMCLGGYLHSKLEHPFSVMSASLGCRRMFRNYVNMLPQWPSGHPIDVNSVGLIDIKLIHYSVWHISTHTRHSDFKSMTCVEINESQQSSNKFTAMQKTYFSFFYVIICF
jgi:hypothetical protein